MLSLKSFSEFHLSHFHGPPATAQQCQHHPVLSVHVSPQARSAPLHPPCSTLPTMGTSLKRSSSGKTNLLKPLLLIDSELAWIAEDQIRTSQFVVVY